MATSREDFEEMRSRAEAMLRHRSSSKSDMTMNVILMCVGIVMAVLGCLVSVKTNEPRVLIWAAACNSFLTGAAFMCWDLYVHFKLKQVVAEMQSAFDLESYGELLQLPQDACVL